MFRCVTTLRGLVIDIDTFEEPIEQWKVLLGDYFCCFLTFKEETKRFLEENFGDDEGDTLRQGVSDANNHTQQMIIVNESGLYSLIFGSKLESAKKFKRWVTNEVLPQLRKTGSYGLSLTTDQQIQLLAKGQVEVTKRLDKNENDIKEVKDDLEELKLDLPLFPVEAEIITKTARRRGTEILGGKQSKAYKRVSIRNTVYRNLYIDINRNFNVRSYKAIKTRDCERAASLIENWTPPLYIEDKIKEANA